MTYPSVVVAQDGASFYVSGLRIPGTIQQLRLKQGDSLTWVPLNQAPVMRFTGPASEGFRPAIVFLTGGDRLRGDVFPNDSAMG